MDGDNDGSRFGEIERIRELVRKHPDVAERSTNELIQEHMKRGDHLADKITAVIGSWKFIITQSALLGVWLVINSVGWLLQWDPYPFILLNLALSFQAAFTAPIIMMSQNRQSARDRIASELDYEINRVAASDVDVIQEKLDALLSQEWSEMMEIMKGHRELLDQLCERTKEIERRLPPLA